MRMGLTEPRHSVLSANGLKEMDKMVFCQKCNKLVEEGTKSEVEHHEYWGSKFIYEEYTLCCSECGSEDIEDAKHCECGEEIEIDEIMCENCKDRLEG